MDELSKTEDKRISVSFTTTQEIKDWIFESAKRDDRSVSMFLSRMFREIIQTDNNS